VPVLCYRQRRRVHSSADRTLPRFGVGSSSCAGREKRTAARSDTPMKRRSTPRNVFSLELSSGGFSTGAFAGVDALEGSLEVAPEFGCEALGAASMFADGSAMTCVVVVVVTMMVDSGRRKSRSQLLAVVWLRVFRRRCSIE
jgi:hypothetical protein